jgi:ankyrin repeat protein
MNKTLLLISFFIFPIQAAQVATEKKPAQEEVKEFKYYNQLSIDNKLKIFKHFISDAYSDESLDKAVDEFVAKTYDTDLVHHDSRFVHAIKNKREDIATNVIPKLQKIQKRLKSYVGIDLDLVKNGPNAQDENGFYAIDIVVNRLGEIKVIKDLLDLGANPNVRNQITGNTPLNTHFLFPAFDQLDVPIIELLIKKGADVNLPDIQGWTPLDQAYLNNETNSDRVKYIIRHGAKANNYYTDETGRIRRKPIEKKYIKSQMQ